SVTNRAGAYVGAGAYALGVYGQYAATVTNSGTLAGTIGFTVAGNGAAAQTVINSGTIASLVGSGGTAVAFGAGNDRLIVDPSAVFVGKVDGGAGTNTLELTSAASTGTLTGLGADFVNFTQGTIDSGASWVFAGANTIGIGTTLTNSGTLRDTGTLQVDGTIVGNTTVQSGGVLDGTGTIGALTVESGGTLAPGDDPGTITTGNLDLQAGSTLSTEVHGPSPGVNGFDQVVVNGSVTLGGTLSALLSGFTPVGGESF